MSWLSKLIKPMNFMDAIRAGKIRRVHNHLKAGIDPNQKVDNGRTYPIYFAVHAGVKIVALLIQYEAQVNVTIKEGETPLHVAALFGYVDVVNLLIEAGAKLNAIDEFGHTPLFHAAAGVSPYDMIYATTGATLSKEAQRERNGRIEVVELLKLYGAYPSQIDVETASAMSSIPEAVRHTRHMAIAYNEGDLEYQQAVREISMQYPFLHDAYRLLCEKIDLSKTEKIFIDNFEQYENMFH